MTLIPLSLKKRSTNGSLLKYSVYVQTKFLTDEIFNHITKLENYKKLNNEPYLDFINIYLKNIFENIYKIVSQLKNN